MPTSARTIKALCMALLFPLLLQADHAKDLATARSQYDKGNYTGAVQSYERIVQGGHESADLYYNLGNAHYKSGNIPAAILHYERALMLRPSDEDAAFNLKLSNLKVVDKIEAMPPSMIDSVVAAMTGLMGLQGWAVMAVVANVLAFVMLGLFVTATSSGMKKAFFFAGVGGIMVAASGWLSASSLYSERTETPSAIVFAPSAYIKSSPDEKGTDLFILHEGTKVKVLDGLADWKKIRIANGNVGWIREKDVVVM
jgi:tetratricopeptide (TPR) repeat protein